MKSVSSGWSFLRDSQQLRAVIKFRMEELDVSITELGNLLEIQPDRISKYLRGIKPSLTNWQLVQIANYLKIEVELNTRLLPTSTPL